MEEFKKMDELELEKIDKAIKGEKVDWKFTIGRIGEEFENVKYIWILSENQDNLKKKKGKKEAKEMQTGYN